MSLIKARGMSPEIGKNVFIADGAKIISDVRVGDGCSIWFNTTLRGDVMPITIGRETNVQDGTVVHGTFGKSACEIGERVTIGHNVTLHGCKIGNGVLVGMGSIIMDNAEIGDRCFVAAGSLVTEGKKFPPGSLIIGRPAVLKRPLNDEELKFLEQSADNYLLYKTWYGE